MIRHPMVLHYPVDKIQEKRHKDNSVKCRGGTGWPRPIGCLKLHVIFRIRATEYRALLRKMTYEDKASCGSSPPCRENKKKNEKIKEKLQE